MNPQNPVIEFSMDGKILAIWKSQTKTLHPEILEALCVSRKELRALFKLATELVATPSVSPMRLWAKEEGGHGNWRVELLPEPAGTRPLPDDPPNQLGSLQ